MDKECTQCINYKSSGCIGEDKRKMIIEDYDTDCWMSEEDKKLCDLLCGGEE